MTYPQNANLGFAGQMYGHLTQNWQFYATAITAVGVGAASLMGYFRHNLDLNDRFGQARLPHKVKAQEAPTFDAQGLPNSQDIQNPLGVDDAPVRLNAGWHDLTEQRGGFTPQEDVRYLWVVKENGHLITGVEDPMNMPQAFTTDLNSLSPESRTAIQGLGHPTLAASFDDDGLRPGAGRIGGELFHENGHWMINDASGRYGKERGDTKPLLENAAQEFRIHGVDVRHIKTKATGDEVIPLEVSAMSDLTHSVGNRINRLVSQVGELAGINNNPPRPSLGGVPPTLNAQQASQVVQ